MSTVTYVQCDRCGVRVELEGCAPPNDEVAAYGYHCVRVYLTTNGAMDQRAIWLHLCKNCQTGLMAAIDMALGAFKGPEPMPKAEGTPNAADRY